MHPHEFSDSETVSIASSDDDALSHFRFSLPPELLTMVLEYLMDIFKQSARGFDASKHMLPLTLVSRSWYELVRPLSLQYVSITPMQASKLLAMLSSPRTWGRTVQSLEIHFGRHYSQIHTPAVLGLIASCSSLENLSLVGCGKPVHKSFVAQSNSVHYAVELARVLNNLKTLKISGTQKEASTGLDAAKVLAFLLPLCPNLISLNRGLFSYGKIPVAALQPIQVNSVFYTTPMPNLQYLTLSSRHIGSRVLQQSRDLVSAGHLRELILVACELPQKKALTDLIKTCPNLESFKVEFPFANHRTGPIFDSLVLVLPKLRKLAYLGPLCSDELLKVLPQACEDLRHLTLAHNRLITQAALSTMMEAYASQDEHDRFLLLDDMTDRCWTTETLCALQKDAQKSGWHLKSACIEWFGDGEPQGQLAADVEFLPANGTTFPWPGQNSSWDRANYVQPIGNDADDYSDDSEAWSDDSSSDGEVN